MTDTGDRSQSLEWVSLPVVRGFVTHVSHVSRYVTTPHVRSGYRSVIERVLGGVHFRRAGDTTDGGTEPVESLVTLGGSC
jgi:hypothetical protein